VKPNHSHREKAWYRKAASLIWVHCYLKGLGTMLFIAVFFGAYFYLLKHPGSKPAVMPLIWLDHLVDFQPLALPIYLSLWLYVSLPPLLLGTRHELYHYGTAIGLMCIGGLAVFYFWPTAVPLADIDVALHPDMGFLKNVDASGNACPSLHVATAMFSGAWLHHLLKRIGAPKWLLFFNGGWCAAIVYSTLATRQHVAIDVAAGLLLGALAVVLSLRHAGKAIRDHSSAERPEPVC
jgi:membrane-associated phospholipid phosphatase